VTHRYAAYGLAIESNRALPGLRAGAAGRADVTVEFAEGLAPQVDDAAARTTARTGSHSTHRCDDGGWLYRLASHGGERAWSMRVSGAGDRIELRWRGAVALADVGALVEVTGVPAALTLRGVPLLHGCVVGAGGAAFLVLGASGAGKSSVAAAAVASGRTLLADDVAALEARAAGVYAHVGGSRLRMNEDTARALGWDPGELERVYVTPDLPPKLFAPLPGEGGGARRVAAIFVLGERRAGQATIERAAPPAALRLLLANTYGHHAADAGLRAALLPFWARVAREVPVHRLAPAEGLESLPALVEALAAAAASPAAAMIRPPCGPPSSSSGRPAP
jgi:hypothetical protein